MHLELKNHPVNSQILLPIGDFDFFLSRFKEAQQQSHKTTWQRSLKLICKYLITPNHRKQRFESFEDLKEHSKLSRVTSSKSNKLVKLTF